MTEMLEYEFIRTALLGTTAIGIVCAYLGVYVFLLAAYVLVLMYMAQHPAMPTPETPLSPKAAEPIGGPAEDRRRDAQLDAALPQHPQSERQDDQGLHGEGQDRAAGGQPVDRFNVEFNHRAVLVDTGR